MNSKAPKLLLDAISAIDTAREFLGACSLQAYEADKMRRSAVERQLEILGEACARLARLEPAWGDDIPSLKLAIGLRNRIIHGYDAVDDEMVYFTVCDDLVPLGSALKQYLDQAGT